MNYGSGACFPLGEISGHSRYLKCNTLPLAMREYRSAMQEYRVSMREYRMPVREYRKAVQEYQ